MMKNLINTTISVGLFAISLYTTEMLGEYRLGDTQIPGGFSVYSQQKLKAGMDLEEAREALAESCLRQAEWNRAFLGSLKDGTLELKPEDIEAFLRQYDIDVNKLNDEDKQNITIFLACGLDKEVVMAASPDERRYLKNALFRGIYFLAIPLSFSENNLLANAIENQLLERLSFHDFAGRRVDREYSGDEEKLFNALCFSTTIRELDICHSFTFYDRNILSALRINKSVIIVDISSKIPDMLEFSWILTHNNTIQKLRLCVRSDLDAYKLSIGIRGNRSLKEVKVMLIGVLEEMMVDGSKVLFERKGLLALKKALFESSIENYRLYKSFKEYQMGN